jgi:hypothetical protein
LSFVDWLRKGFGYVLLSMGVSRPAARPKSKHETDPAAERAPKPGDGSGSQSGGANKSN